MRNLPPDVAVGDVGETRIFGRPFALGARSEKPERGRLKIYST